MAQQYRIKLPVFEGPFDLLLYFIDRDEIDIYDIPISQITSDFLDYIRQMEEADIKLASEFILVAATLMRIKARWLLPRKEVDDAGEEVDPREELVRRLLEYKKFKKVQKELKQLEDERTKIFERQPQKQLSQIAGKAIEEMEIESVTISSLFNAFKRVLSSLEERHRTIHRVYRYKVTVQEQRHYIQSLFYEKERLDFENLFTECTDRISAIITFLALLEMINSQELQILERPGVNNFFVVMRDEEE